jgi:hypothetical protein
MEALEDYAANNDKFGQVDVADVKSVHFFAVKSQLLK